MSTSSDMGATAPVVNTAAAKVRPRQRGHNIQFPYQSHCSVDEAMKQSIERLARKWRWKEAQVHRNALVFYLSTNDPVFARENQNA
jgi:hypothetical protein